MSDPLMVVEDVSKTYRRKGREPVHALAEVSLTVAQGRTIGVVGESGSGKSTLTRMLLGLEEPSSGTVRFRGTPISGLDAGGTRTLRHTVSAVFQNPYSSLSPRMRIGAIVTEQLAIEGAMSRRQRQERARAVLEEVGLVGETAERYPHQISGGQRQRVAIARALVHEPELIVLDEPTSALDVSVSAQVVNLLLELQERRGLSYVFVAHDMHLVRHLCHDVVVLRQGRVVESGPADEVLVDPQDDYTRDLLTASALESLEPVQEADTAVADPAAPHDDPLANTLR